MDSMREPATVDRFARLQQDFVGRVEMIVDIVDSLGLVISLYIYIIITFVRSLVA